jgi:hypothetical protein
VSFTTTLGASDCNNGISALFNYNSLSAVSNKQFRFGNAQLEIGSTVTALDPRPIGVELALCQRYYCKTFDQGVAPAQNTGNFSGALEIIGQVTGTTMTALWFLPVTMRTVPVLTLYSPNGASANWSTNTDTPISAGGGGGPNVIGIRASAPITTGRAYAIHAACVAEPT